MRRIIEDLVEKRKEKQKQLQNTLSDLAGLLGKRGFLKKRKYILQNKFQELNTVLNDLLLTQDREWDAYSNNHSTRVFKSLQWKIEKLEAEYSNVKTLLMNFIELERSLKKIIDKSDKKSFTKDDITELKEIKERLSVDQYSNFEQRFRGSEQQIKELLRVYLPHFKGRDDILDIGCGRGEFLELLDTMEKKKSTLGIDISVSMLKIATEKGIRCIKKEAVDFLKECEVNKFGGIFSSQVIEHLSPEELSGLVSESFRVLKPDSPIILETVNPLSLFALSNIYFLDISHQKPLHPEYMRYLLETSGFSEVEILYSGDLKNESLETVDNSHHLAKVLNTNIDKLNNLLFSSPCYAVKGIKRV
jgi:O-antigen chain-terminating methyltransferase